MIVAVGEPVVTVTKVVAVLTDPAQYPGVLQELQKHQGALSLATRRQLAAAAFARIAAYDQAISAYFAGQQEGEPFPPVLQRQWRRRGPAGPF